MIGFTYFFKKFPAFFDQPMSGLHLPVFIILIAYGIQKGFSFPQNMRHDHVNMRDAQLNGKYACQAINIGGGGVDDSQIRIRKTFAKWWRPGACNKLLRT